MKPDKEFLLRLKNRDQQAQQELYKRFNARLLLYFRIRIKGEEHYQDLVQEVFASFFDGVSKDKVISDQYIAPFMFGIARRVMYNYFYKKKRSSDIQQKINGEFDISYDFEEEERLEIEALTGIVDGLVEKLPGVDRVILKEFYLEERSLGEVADRLERSKHYVSVRKERALKKIKSEILKQKELFNS
jgi:RNA polymerase sigma factor (sigma-70 family)